MEITRKLTALFFCMLALPASASELVAIGRVTQITLFPISSAHCSLEDRPGTKFGVTKLETVVVTTSAGCGEAKITLDRVLIGDVSRREITAKWGLGEWWGPGFPLSDEPILVRITDDYEPEWAILHSDSHSDYRFEIAMFSRIGSVNVDTLKRRDGFASLNELIRRLGL